MGPARRPHSLGLTFRSLRRRALASGPDRAHAHPGAGLAVKSPGAEAPPGPEPDCRAEGPRPAPGWGRFRPARGPRRPGHGRGRSARGSGPGRRGGLGSAGGARARTRAGARPERGEPGEGEPPRRPCPARGPSGAQRARQRGGPPWGRGPSVLPLTPTGRPRLRTHSCRSPRTAARTPPGRARRAPPPRDRRDGRDPSGSVEETARYLKLGGFESRNLTDSMNFSYL